MAWRDWIEWDDCSSVDSDSSASKNRKTDKSRGIYSPFKLDAKAKDAKDAKATTLLMHCRQACREIEVDPKQLAEWLIAQGDPDWLHPAPVYWWASRIARHGFPEN